MTMLVQFTLAALTVVFSAAAGIFFAEKALKAHSTLPAQHQMADRLSGQLTGDHSRAFTVSRHWIKKDQVFSCPYLP